MWLLRTGALASLFLAWAALPAPAQERAPKTKLSAVTTQDSCRVHVFTRGGGARLGIQVRTERNPATDSIGALIANVTSDGPADKAGLRKGDIITRLNGERLATAGTDDERRPGMRLVELARALGPGDTARVEYRRDGKTTTQTIVAERLSFFSFRTPGSEGFEMDFEMPDLGHLRDLRRHFEFALPFRHRLHSLELVDLNPDLGSYFGATEGLLVVDVRDDSSLGLKAGDVLLSIDGRKPTSPGHALRILASYEPEDTIRFEVLRQKKKQTIDGKVPERTFDVRMPEPPEEP